MSNPVDIIMDFWGKDLVFKKFVLGDNHKRQRELVQAYRTTGDEDAYEELLMMVTPLMRGFAHQARMTDLDEFKLVCLERFHKCVLEYDLESDTGFSTYLKVMLRYVKLDHLNYYVEDRNTHQDYRVEVEEELNEFILSDEKELDKITDIRFYLALDKLTKRERQVITMYYFEGKGEVDIIKELGIKESSFTVYLSKSKKAFREAYTEVLELDLLQLSDEEMEL